MPRSISTVVEGAFLPTAVCNLVTFRIGLEFTCICTVLIDFSVLDFQSLTILFEILCISFNLNPFSVIQCVFKSVLCDMMTYMWL